MNCNDNIFQDFLSNCNDQIVLNALLTPGQLYKWVFTNRLGNEYSGTANADVYGTSLTIDITDTDTIPAGLFSNYSGAFSLKLFDTTDECKQIPFKMTRYYDEVVFEMRAGTNVKDNLGCNFN